MKYTPNLAVEKSIENWKDPVKRAKWSKAIKDGQIAARAWKLKMKEAKKEEIRKEYGGM